MKSMIKPILYSNIAEKKIFNEGVSEILSPLESLIQGLNVMDLNAALKQSNNINLVEVEDIVWIELKFRNDR